MKVISTFKKSEGEDRVADHLPHIVANIQLVNLEFYQQRMKDKKNQITRDRMGGKGYYRAVIYRK